MRQSNNEPDFSKFLFFLQDTIHCVDVIRLNLPRVSEY